MALSIGVDLIQLEQAWSHAFNPSNGLGIPATALTNYRNALDTARGFTHNDADSDRMWPAFAALWYTTSAAAGVPAPAGGEFPLESWLDWMRDRGIVPMLFVTPGSNNAAWYVWDTWLAGDHDAWITAFAHRIKDWATNANSDGTDIAGRRKTSQIIVRFAHEMNGNYANGSFEWQNGKHGNTAAKYISVFDRFQSMTQAIAPMARFFYCPLGQDAASLTASLPTNPDYIGFDVYSDGPDWTSMRGLYVPLIDRLAAASSAPIIVGETGVANDIPTSSVSTAPFTKDHARASWISGNSWSGTGSAGGYEWIANNRPQVKGIAYFQASGAYAFDYDDNLVRDAMAAVVDAHRDRLPTLALAGSFSGAIDIDGSVTRGSMTHTGTLSGEIVLAGSAAPVQNGILDGQLVLDGTITGSAFVPPPDDGGGGGPTSGQAAAVEHTHTVRVGTTAGTVAAGDDARFGASVMPDGTYGDVTVSGSGTDLEVGGDSHGHTAATVTTHSTAHAHSDLTSVGTDDHHAKSHVHTGDGSGTVAHGSLGSVTANQHHNQAHAISGADHTGSVAAAQMPALTGDVTTTAGAVATSIAARAVTAAKLFAASATNKFLMRKSASGGDWEEGSAADAKLALAIGASDVSGLAAVATSGSASDLGTGTLPIARIAAGAVTLAKMDDLAQDQFIGRTAASTGVPQTATITSAARSVLDDTTVAAMRATLGVAYGTDVAQAGLASASGLTVNTINRILGRKTTNASPFAIEELSSADVKTMLGYYTSGDSPTFTGANITGIPESGVTGLVADLAAKSAVGHGVADHADVTRFLPLYAKDADVDSGTLATLGSSPNLLRVITLADVAATQGAYWTFLVPSNWSSGSLSCRPLWVAGSTDASAHSVVWLFTAKIVSGGADVTAAGTSSGNITGQAAARTANRSVTGEALTDLGVTPSAANQLVMLNVSRVGGAAADNYVGAVHLYGVLISFTADQ